MPSDILSSNIPYVRPPSEARPTMPVLGLSFLLYAKKDTFAVFAVRLVSLDKFLQYAMFHFCIVMLSTCRIYYQLL